MSYLGNTQIKKAYLGSTELTSSNAYIGEDQLIPIQPVRTGVTDELKFTSQSDGSTVYIEQKGTGIMSAATFVYCTNGTDWYDYTFNTTITLNNGESVYFAAKNYIATTSTTDSNTAAQYKRGRFHGSGSWKISGDLRSMIKPDYETLTTLPCGSCWDMFAETSCWSDVSSLKVISENTEPYALQGTFFSCTGFNKSPILRLTGSHGYRAFQYLFYQSSNVNYVQWYGSAFTDNHAFDYWLYYASSTGTFRNYGNYHFPVSNTSAIPSGWTETYSKNHNLYPYLTFVASGDTSTTSTVKLTVSSGTYQYSYSMGEVDDWTDYTSDTTISISNNTVSQPVALAFRAKDGVTNTGKIGRFYVTGNVGVIGHIRTMFNSDYTVNISKIPDYGCQQLFLSQTAITNNNGLFVGGGFNSTVGQYAFQSMFGNTGLQRSYFTLDYLTLQSHACTSMYQGCTSLCNGFAPRQCSLDAYACSQMYKGCTSLTTVYQFINNTATGNYTYDMMFEGCTSLTTMPSMATNSVSPDYACFKMFSGCTALTTVSQLPSTALTHNTYHSMFQGCTSLTTVPSNMLPATTLGEGNYRSMFEGCTSLTTAPELPATSASSYAYCSMFSGCSSLTTAPELPATTLASQCYESMFQGCTSLNSVITYATDISASDCLSNWLYNVAATGTFYNYGGATYPSGVSGIPTGWTEYTWGITYKTSDSAITSPSNTSILVDDRGNSATVARNVYSSSGRMSFTSKVVEFGNATKATGFLQDNTKITYISFPFEVTRLGYKCLNHCTALKTVDLPSTIEYLDYGCFGVCYALTTINYDGTMAQWNAITKGANLFYDIHPTIYCSDGNITT